MRVWIDQNLCTGDRLCTEIAPAIFEMDDDGLAYVKHVGQVSLRGTDGQPIHTGGGDLGVVEVPAELGDDVIEAAAECPGECIFIIH